MWESSVESKFISFAQNFFKNSLNQSVIRDHLGNCLIYNVIVSGDVLKAELYILISKKDMIFVIVIDAMVTSLCMFLILWEVANFVK